MAFVKRAMNAPLWIIGLILSSVVPFLLVSLLVPIPYWWAVCFGAGLVAVNSVVARLMNDWAVGGTGRAFWGWGIIANAIRMLTLIMIFAYMCALFREERGAFLISGFSAFFVMMPVEIIQLLKSQNKAIEKLEYGRDAN